MLNILYSIDVSLFYFINHTISNVAFDIVMPFLTDLNKTLFGRLLAATIWILLLVKGGKKGRIVGLMLIPMIVLTDQFSSGVIKKIVMRPRPCHEIAGMPILANIRLLVDCGGGYSFPSSHAVNNIGAATYFSYFYRKWTWAFFVLACLVALSRVYVGVHYPSDILGGAIIGALCAGVFIGTWKILAKRFPTLNVDVTEASH